MSAFGVFRFIIYLLLTSKDIKNPNTKIGKQEKTDAFKNVESSYSNCLAYPILKIEQQMKGSILKTKAHERRDSHIF